jgi:hypothetical protein
MIPLLPPPKSSQNIIDETREKLLYIIFQYPPTIPTETFIKNWAPLLVLINGKAQSQSNFQDFYFETICKGIPYSHTTLNTLILSEIICKN